MRLGRLWLGVCLVICGCGPKRTPYPEALLSERPGERILAIQRAGESMDRSAVAVLVDSLEDEDEAVRFYAILALEKLTGTRMGFEYQASEVQRARSVDRWRRYVRGGPPASAPAAQWAGGPGDGS